MTSSDAKRLLCASAAALLALAFSAPGARAGEGVYPRLECGTYWVDGYFSQSLKGDFLLTLRKGTSAPIELLPLGGSFSQKLERVGTYVRAEIYVPSPIAGIKQPFVFLRSFPDRSIGMGTGYHWLRSLGACADQSQYVESD